MPGNPNFNDVVGANTPGAIAYTAYGGRSGTVPYTAYRMPTAEESASSQLQAQISALPADIQAKIKSGELVPNYTMVNTGGGRAGQGTIANGISGFYSPSANDTTTHYDLSGNQTSVTKNQHSSGGLLGGISDALAGLDSSLHLSQLAPVLAAVGLDYATGGAASGALSSIFGGGGAAAAGDAALGTAGTAGATGAMAGDAAAAGAAGAANTIAATVPAIASSTPLAEIGATPVGEGFAGPITATSTFTPATTSLSSIGTDAASAGLTSAPAAAGLTAPVATDAASAGAAGTGAAGLTAGQIAASDLAAYPTAGIVGEVPAAAGPANGIAAAGAGLGAAGAAGAGAGAGAGLGAAGAAAGTGLSNYLKQLTDVTGLNGTQLASLLQGGIGAVNSSNISSAIGAGVNAQADANAKSQDILKGVYDTTTGYYKPYQTAGANAINALDAQQPYLTHQFDATDLQKGLAPNYDFMLQQGQMANQRAANVGGGALSGNTLQGLQNYTQNYAGNAYQNAFNNYQTQRNNIYNSLAGIANIGNTANTGAATAGANYGKGTVDLNTGLAGVRAAGMLGQAQANASGATGVGNSVLLSTLLNQINPINPVKP
jgi:hypothetical protein